MLTSIDVANHWPFIRRHLLIDRSRSLSRGLELLASGQAAAAGDPVPMGATRLRTVGLTPGEAGNVWRNLDRARRAGVVSRYAGTGARPSLWYFVPSLDRWRLPWRWSGREVEAAIAGCVLCRAGYAQAARSAGRDPGPLRDSEEFHLAQDVHLGIRQPGRDASPDGRAIDFHNVPADLPRGHAERASGARDKGSLSFGSKEGEPLTLDPEGEGEGIRAIRNLIKAQTGQDVYPASGPDRQVREAARIVGPEGLPALLAELGLATRGLQAAPVAAAKALALAPIVAADVWARAEATREADARRLAQLEREIREFGAGDEPTVLEEARVLRERLDSLGADED
jgi:hypothetical protein